MQLEQWDGVSPNPRKSHSSPALASGQICLPSPFPAATEISSQESEELEDQLSRVIHFLVLTELPSKCKVLRPPPSPVRASLLHSEAQLECITLHPGRGPLPKHASAALLLLKGTGLEVA